MTFRRRVTLLSSGAVALAILIAMAAAYLMVYLQLKAQLDNNLEKNAARVSAFALDYSGPGTTGRDLPDDVLERRKATVSRSEMERSLNRISRQFAEVKLPLNVQAGQRLALFPYGRQVEGADFFAEQIISANGQITKMTSSSDLVPRNEEAMQVADGTKESFFYQQEINGEPVRVYVTELSDGFAVQVARSLNDVNRALGKLRWVLSVVALFGIGIAAVFGWFVARAALSPVTRFATAAESIAQTRDLALRMDIVGDQDLDRLAQSFNTMMDALEQSLNAQQRLVADASHELRTPLTSLRTNIEVLLQSDALPLEKRKELVKSVVVQIDEVTNLIGDLINLARETEVTVEASENIRLDELVEGVVERADRGADRLTIKYESEPCEVFGASESLERAVSNLLENAVKWSPDGGEIEVRVSDSGEVTVRDHGPGVAAADTELIFDRFYRSPEARDLPGSGLGLSIVRQIAENHGGTITVSEAPGGGALFRLDLGARAGARADS